jgi:hypothetical protein
MKTWLPTIDPATIPDDVLRSERAKRNSAMRQTRSGGRNGGRPPSCDCGACALCLARAKRQAKRAQS